MNAVEIEAAVSELASAPYDSAEFPFQFLAAFDKKETTLKRLRKGDSNKSDIPGAVLLINSIHVATCPAGKTREMLERLKASPKTISARAKFIFVTDGSYFEAEDLTGAQEPVDDFLANLANHFGFFLPLAGISTVREIKDNPIDVRATGRLNKLYVELLRINPEWGAAARRHDMNHFMARLIFCYFAEHTDIFNGYRLFTETIEQMSEGDGSNTHQVMEQTFRAMDVKIGLRATSDVPPYANQFPYVNGGLFRGSAETPRFNRIARSYLLQAGKLEWHHINPDIFGSMIQAVADDEERGALGMHYTSVPNILKVLNPLFLDDLRSELELAGDNGRMLLKLRQRMSRIRIFDPACGSGNFLVIAYKQMRSVEAEINQRRGEPMRPTDISKKNFRGIEMRDFAAEIARLALVIAEYQCDVAHRGPLAAKAEFLPLDEMNWIVCDNALSLDWVKVCPPTGATVTLHSDDLFQTPLDQTAIDFENEGGETYICGNPPYKGSKWQTDDQKADLVNAWIGEPGVARNSDYVTGWFGRYLQYAAESPQAVAAFVATNSGMPGSFCTS
jgi:SAM-dependent methyltransferase